VVEAPDSALAAYTRRAFIGLAPGPYAPRQLLSTLDRLYTTGLFEGIWPRVDDDGAGGARLVVRAEAPPRRSLAAALGYDSDRFGRVWLSFQRGTALMGAPTVASVTALATGREQMGAAEVRAYPVRLSPLVATLGAFVRETDVRFVRAGDDVEVSRAGAWGSVELHQLLNERVAVGMVRAERIGVDGRGEGWSVGPLLRVSVPQAERPVVGTTGFAEAEARWGDVRYQQARARGSFDARAGALQAAVVLDGAAVWGDAPPDVLPSLGEEWLVPGYRWGEARGRARLVGGVDAAWQTPLGAYLRTRVRAGAVAQDVDAALDTAPWAVGAEVGLFHSSPFGAFSLGVGFSNRGEPRVTLDLGPEF
jgi:hypothetical protein